MKTILLIGSSIFEAWTRAPDLFPDWHTVNRSVGGTQTADWTMRLADALEAEAPAVVWYYCGSNDLNGDVMPDEIFDNVLQSRSEIDRSSTATRFAYFGIIKAPQKKGKWAVIDTLNAQIQAALKPGDLYVDTNAVFFPGTAPDAELFLEDGLHLTDNAYAKLSNYVTPIIGKWLNSSLSTHPENALDGN